MENSIVIKAKKDDLDQIMCDFGDNFFRVISISKKIIEIDIPGGGDLVDFTKIIMGLFNRKSNFSEMLKPYVDFKIHIKDMKIKFDFNGIDMEVSADTRTVKEVVKKYHKELNAKFEKKK